MSWFILVVNALFLLWVIVGAADKGPAVCSPGMDAQACADLTAAGKGIGIGILIMLWTMVDVILLVLWLVTKPKAKPQIVYVQAPPAPYHQPQAPQVPQAAPSSQRPGDLYR